MSNKNNEDKFYTCKYDRPFKEIFLKESNRDILKLILENILRVSITDIKINNIERNTGNLSVRRKYLDALLTTNEGKIEIEVNAYDEDYVRPRNTSYICDIYSHHTLVKEEYSEDTKIIQINLSYGINDTKNMRIYKLRDEEGKEYVSNLIIYEVNMEYYKKIWYDKDEREIDKNKYLIMMDLGEEELKEISKNDKVVIRYMEDLVNINKDPEFREYMTVEEDLRKIRNSILNGAKRKARLEGLEEGLAEGKTQGLAQGKAEGKEEGKAEGKKENQIEIAKNMLKENIDINLIIKCTGLVKEEIETLNTD